MRGLAICTAIAAACALAVPAVADETVHFTLGRVIHATPDARDRIGIRSTCAEAGGCKVEYTILRRKTSIGGTEALLIGNTAQTDYVTLTKRMAARLRRQRVQVTISAVASNPAGAKVTQTKTVVLGPKKKR